MACMSQVAGCLPDASSCLQMLLLMPSISGKDALTCALVKIGAAALQHEDMHARPYAQTHGTHRKLVLPLLQVCLQAEVDLTCAGLSIAGRCQR